MSIPPVMPVPGADKVPVIGDPPSVPVKAPEPDWLPDEQPVPNPTKTLTRSDTLAHMCTRLTGACFATV